MRGIVKKWRPSLALVIGGTLGAVLILPVLGIVYLRLWGAVLGWGEAATLVAVMALMATGVLAFLLWRLVLRPVYALTGYAHAVKGGAAPVAPVHFGTPEFSRLGASVMAMGDALNSRALGLQAYADHVTHELKSPLTAMRGAAELLEADATGPDACALAQTIGQAAHRMDALLTDLHAHAQAATPAAPGQSTVRAALDALDTPLAVHLGPDGPLPLAQSDLCTVLTQILHNAADHGAHSVTLSVEGATLRIVDDGPGISAGNRDRVFDPFFTTRRDAGGTGMGLSIVRSLVLARGGRVEVLENAPGAQFLITFD